METQQEIYLGLLTSLERKRKTGKSKYLKTELYISKFLSLSLSLSLSSTCRLNIVDLEKQAALINDSFLTTPTHHQNANATLGGGGPSTAIAAAGGGNLQNREQSGSDHSSSSDADTHISEDPSHHSVHILHRISLPANDDAMDGQPPNKRNILNLYARTNGAGGGKN